MFIVFYSGERAKNKILKLCEAFGANRYPFTEDLSKQFQMITEVHIMLFLCISSQSCGLEAWDAIWLCAGYFTFGDYVVLILYF